MITIIIDGSHFTSLSIETIIVEHTISLFIHTIQSLLNNCSTIYSSNENIDLRSICSLVDDKNPREKNLYSP
jgi:hypothetical protein